MDEYFHKELAPGKEIMRDIEMEPESKKQTIEICVAIQLETDGMVVPVYSTYSLKVAEDSAWETGKHFCDTQTLIKIYTPVRQNFIRERFYKFMKAFKAESKEEKNF